MKKTLNDQRYEVTAGKTRSSLDAPILGLYQTTSEDGGRLVLYGDSNCLDAAPLQRGKVDNQETNFKKTTKKNIFLGYKIGPTEHFLNCYWLLKLKGMF